MQPDVYLQSGPSTRSPTETTVTVFTPTFNRGRLLRRVFVSLQNQTFQGFEWLIVDDGSTDGTEDIVRAMAAESPFPVRYHRQKNSGKHVAVNQGVRLAEGILFLILDSDDRLVPGALERIRYWWETIPIQERSSFAGVVGLYADRTGKLLGSGLPQNVLDTTTIELRTRYRVRGDTLHVYRTDVLRQYPFPENLGSFVTEALVWNRIARGYRVRCVNEVWGEVGYQPDGLSARSTLLRVKSPHAARLYYKEFTEIPDMGISVVRRVREYANFARFSLHAGVPWTQQLQEVQSRVLWALGAPIGSGVFLRDRLRLARAGGQER
ncbi:MAG TPA: glycosyltransferase [Candidatus Bipolaricaulis anaerobius]|nr:glycosyltransferase [Candidatus Bipolaricaulis anaerobius]HNS24027.1 glycosyltransferase [Candidatus Bipolaricaulis anaerobius]